MIPRRHSRRKLRDGGRNIHYYYKCGNNHRPDTHPNVRWREADLERAIVDDLDSLRIPHPHAQRWFRGSLEAMFQDATRVDAERRKVLAKRRSELANMQDRLLNAFLSGTVDEPTYQAKASELMAQAADVEGQLDGAVVTEEAGRLALTVFDFSQNLVDIWRGSNYQARRTILECVSSNRTLSDVTIALEKRKPFDVLAKGLVIDIGRGDRI